MKLFTATLMLALALTTGFTCNKNAPPAEPQTEQAPPPPEQDQMGAPAEAPPVEAMPADGTNTAPTEGSEN